MTDGFAGTVADDGVADALAGAHLSYQEKVDLLASAQSELEATQAALEAAKADKETTAAELAAAEADYAVAKEAYDRLVAMLGSGEGTVEVPEEPEEPEAVRPGGQRTPEQQAQLEALPQTGDPTSFAAAGGMALAGAAAVAAAVVGGAHFRRHAE